MDPVVLTVLGSIAVAVISGIALVRSSRSNATATATATLVEGQDKAIKRMEAQIAARESTIEDLRQHKIECEDKLHQLELSSERQTHELNAAHERLEMQGREIGHLKARITELGDERLP